MADPSELLRSVAARIAHDEMVARIGRPAPVAIPDGAPPITALAARSFPLAVRERRLHVLRALGWIGEVIDESVPGMAPALPPEATIEDHLAVVGAAQQVHVEDEAWATLASALGAVVTGAQPALDADVWWDAVLDSAADCLDPAWRRRVLVGEAAFARLEAVTLAGDAFFGRRRRSGPWESLREMVRRAGMTKRRLAG